MQTRLVTWAAALLALPAAAQICNLKVVTDANPDYSDIGSLIHSATGNWPSDREKVWAMWYWNHLARRQTDPMYLHGLALTDPIRQFNDYGFTMCSTIAGLNCALFSAMGYPVRYWDISLHTVMDVEYDGAFHMLDNSLSALYTLCDGQTLAAVPDIGREGACEASGGKVEPGHIAKYHCLNATSPNGFLTGADTRRSLASEYNCFNPAYLKYRYYYNDWDLGHRYILNLREGESYTRYYRRLDADSTNAVPQGQDGKHRADPAYFTPNPQGGSGGTDPETRNPRYRLRGNGVRTYAPRLDAAGIAKHLHASNGLRAADGGLQPEKAGVAGEAVFRVQGANVITSLKIDAAFERRGADDVNTLDLSTDWGRTWTNVWTHAGTGPAAASLRVVDAVNGSYDVLVKVGLLGRNAAADARLKALTLEAVTQLNSKTQPRLQLGRNTVHVGAGRQEESVVLWPDLRGDAWRRQVVEARNVVSYRSDKTGLPEHPTYCAILYAENPKEEAYIVLRVDTPADLTGLTYGGRFCNRAPGSRIDLLHSFDGGTTWTNAWTLTDNTSPWDVIHYAKAAGVPPGSRSVLAKYLWRSPNGAEPKQCGLYALRLEANYRPADTDFRPLEVAFTWKEVQADRSTVQRSHVQRVEALPCTYAVNVGGADHPVMEALRISPVGAQPAPAAYGYSDGRDAGGGKFRDRWMTVGKVLSVGKPYTCTEKSGTNWGAGDPDGKKLTDGIVGCSESGGLAFSDGALFDTKQKPEITVDLGSVQACGAFRMHVSGYPWWDALQGAIKDQAEVLTSTDGATFASAGFIDFNTWRKDVPANFMVPDDEALTGYNGPLVLDRPVQARYVRFKVTPARFLIVTEVQVLDRIAFEPFDFRIALPDGQDRSDITRYPLKHVPSKPYVRP